MADPTNPNSAAVKSTRARRRKGAGAPVPSGSAPASAELTRITASDRHAMIATAAYYRAERRQFAPGFEVEDWIAAEAEVDASLVRGDRSS